jgi:hypothetical protein
MKFVPRRHNFLQKLDRNPSFDAPGCGSTFISSPNSDLKPILTTSNIIAMPDAALAAARDASEPINNSNNITSSTLFPRLPMELRLKIFGHAMPGARRVHLTFNASDELRSDTTIPALLHVCKESRQEALKVYKPLLDPTQAVIYFSFERDVLHFGTKDGKDIPTYSRSVPAMFISRAGSTLIGKIQRIAMGPYVLIPYNKFPRLLEFTRLYSEADVAVFLNQRAPLLEKDFVENIVTSWKRRFADLQSENRGWQCPQIRVEHFDKE